MKPVVHLDIPCELLSERVPPDMRHILPVPVRLPAQVALIVFRDPVTISGKVAKALGEVPAPAHLVAVAHNITQEGVELLKARSATLFVARDWYWTDDSYAAIKSP